MERNEVVLNELRRIVKLGKLSRIPVLGKRYLYSFTQMLEDSIKRGAIAELREETAPIAALFDLHEYIEEKVASLPKQPSSESPLFCPMCAEKGIRNPLYKHREWGGAIFILCPKHDQIVPTILPDKPDYYELLKVAFMCLSPKKSNDLFIFFNGIDQDKVLLARKGYLICYGEGNKKEEAITRVVARLCEIPERYFVNPEMVVRSGKINDTLRDLELLIDLVSGKVESDGFPLKRWERKKGLPT